MRADLGSGRRAAGPASRAGGRGWRRRPTRRAGSAASSDDRSSPSATRRNGPLPDRRPAEGGGAALGERDGRSRCAGTRGCRIA